MINELGEEYTEALYKYCDHIDFSLRKRDVGAGGFQYVRQCISCGKVLSNAIKKEIAIKQNKNIEPIEFNNELHGEWERYRNLFWDKQDSGSLKKAELLNQKLKESREIDNQVHTEYNNYLLSSEWNKKRELVLKRSNGVCEGCGVNKAQQVHHLTYNNLFNEFLFELVAVCIECHEKIHPHMKKDNSEIKVNITANDFNGSVIASNGRVKSVTHPRLSGLKGLTGKSVKNICNALNWRLTS
jgi:hypothetical protein